MVHVVQFNDCVVQIGPVASDTFTWPELEENDAVVFSELVKLSG